MHKPPQAAAEAHFTLKQKQNKQIQKEKDKARQERLDRMGRLKTHRKSQVQSGKATVQVDGANELSRESREAPKPKNNPNGGEDFEMDLLETLPHLRRPTA